jgi:hypothetical protein
MQDFAPFIPEFWGPSQTPGRKVAAGCAVRINLPGTYKVRNEIETKRNEINENETKRNQQKRNETKRNQRNENETNESKTKSTKTKRNRLIRRKWKEKITDKTK